MRIQVELKNDLFSIRLLFYRSIFVLSFYICFIVLYLFSFSCVALKTVVVLLAILLKTIDD